MWMRATMISSRALAVVTSGRICGGYTFVGCDDPIAWLCEAKIGVYVAICCAWTGAPVDVSSVLAFDAAFSCTMQEANHRQPFHAPPPWQLIPDWDKAPAFGSAAHAVCV